MQEIEESFKISNIDESNIFEDENNELVSLNEVKVKINNPSDN